MRNDALLAAIFVLAATCVVAAQEITIRTPFGLDNFDDVTFDENRVSVDDVKHWMKFAEWGDYGSFGISLAGCDQTGAARTSKLLKQGQQISEELNRETEYPPKLLPVVTYLKRLLLLRLWMGEQYLVFMKTRTLPEPTYQHIDAPACGGIAEHIQNESDVGKACQLLAGEWTQCTLKSSLLQVGNYPKSQWKEFLQANGIHERVILTDND
jgi:hypothetical protein